MEYLINKAAGNTVAYAEQVKDTEDIMKVELGNFPPGESLTIIFSYLVNLDVINEVNWAFRIPSTLTPRYDPVHKTSTPVSYHPGYQYTAIGAYTWDINVNIFWPGGAKAV